MFGFSLPKLLFTILIVVVVPCPFGAPYVGAAGARACGRDDCPYPG
jgi:hypothetical protein